MTGYSTEFDALRKNRVEVSHYKYGSARDNFDGGSNWEWKEANNVSTNHHNRRP